jgi:dipeptidyl-peptidase-4
MEQKYSRAAEFTGANIAGRRERGTVDGYWIGNSRFFYTTEQWNEALGCLCNVASILDWKSKSRNEITGGPRLRQLLLEQTNIELSLPMLATAKIDMPDETRVAISAGGYEFLLSYPEYRVQSHCLSLGEPALYSPDHRSACLVRGPNLAVIDLASREERLLTTDGSANCAYGQVAESALSAVSYRRCPAPQGLWSADSRWLLTHLIDERPVPILPLVQHASGPEQRPVLHQYRYSMPGDPVAEVVPVAIDMHSGTAHTFAEFRAPLGAFSLHRKAWFGDKDTAWLIQTDRYWKQLQLVCLDLATGTGRVILTEKANNGYVDAHPIIVGTPNVRTLDKSREVIWYSERTDRGHLYLYDIDTGIRKNAITQGDYTVRDIVHVDEANRRLYFLAGCLDSRDLARRCLCRIDLTGENFLVLERHDGDIFLSPTEPCGMEQDRPFRPCYAPTGIESKGLAVIRYSNTQSGNRTEMIDVRALTPRIVARVPLARADNSSVSVREVSVKAADGATPLFAALFLPPDFDEGASYPIIDYIYPGPQIAQKPQAHWSINASPAMSLAQLGFVVLMLDTRGTPGRDRYFHQVGYGQLLEPQLADHAAAIEQLIGDSAFLDRHRVGIIGHSGGGFAAARAMFDYSGLFTTGVSICGNHNPDLYAASWSDRFRGPITDRRASYLQSSNATAEKLEGNLLVISGDMDDNVHPAQSLSLVSALIKANKKFDLLLVPNASHLLFLTNGYVQRRIWDFLVENLLKVVPPKDFHLEFREDYIPLVHEKLWRDIRQ